MDHKWADDGTKARGISGWYFVSNGNDDEALTTALRT